MDTARYVVALLTVVSVPPAIVFWLLVHPNVRSWRRRYADYQKQVPMFLPRRLKDAPTAGRR